MRALLLLAALLPLALLVPTAAAEPVPPRCDERPVLGPVSLNDDCGLTAEARLMSCPLAGSWKTYHVGNNVVSVYTCDGV